MFEDKHVIPYYRNVHPEMEKRFRNFEEKYGVMNDETRKIVYLALCYYVQNIDDAVFRGDLQRQRYDNRYTIRVNYDLMRDNTEENYCIKAVVDYFEIFGVSVDVHKVDSMGQDFNNTYLIMMQIGDLYKINGYLQGIRATNLEENLREQTSNGFHYFSKEGIISQTPNIFTTGVSLKRITDEFMTFGF